jgi:hypothetical protein
VTAWGVQVGQRRYVLLYLYMALEGGGVVPGKQIIASARRLRVTCVALLMLTLDPPSFPFSADMLSALPCCFHPRASHRKLVWFALPASHELKFAHKAPLIIGRLRKRCQKCAGMTLRLKWIVLITQGMRSTR